jgi:hypothetical protein
MQSRRQHIIKPNHRLNLPNQYICVDTETIADEIDDLTVEHHLRLGVAVYIKRQRNKVKAIEEWYSFTSSSDFWQWVFHFTAPKTKLYIYAHNMGFDARALNSIEHLTQNGWVLKKMILKSPPFLLQFHKDACTIELVDSMNYFAMSLSKLGESLQCEKGRMPEFNAPDSDWFPYCKQDVVVLQRAIATFIDLLETEELGGLKLSLASTAMSIYRHKFMAFPIAVHCNDSALKLERLSYFGGRVEPFVLGKFTEMYHLLDVNSMYPFVMMVNSYPINLIESINDADIKTILRNRTKYSFVAHVDISTDRPLYPRQHEGKLIYPIGHFETVLSSPELLNALENDHVLAVKHLLVYENAPIFEPYCKALYTLRMRFREVHNDAFSLICKLLLNSLYGKFGQLGVEWEQKNDGVDLQNGYYKEYDGDAKIMREYRCLAGLLEERIQRGESYDSCPAIASHVTSFARTELARLMAIAGPGNYIYCDTDSLIVNDDGLLNLEPHIDNKQLGKLKYEGSSAQVTIRGPKDYDFGGHTKIKGIRKNAEQVSENVYRQDKFDSFVSSLRQGKTEGVIIRRTTKRLLRQYTKATVNYDGSLSPLIFDGLGLDSL